MSINGIKRGDEAGKFFGGGLDEKEAMEMMSQNGIDYVIGGNVAGGYSFLGEIYKNGNLGLYKIR